MNEPTISPQDAFGASEGTSQEPQGSPGLNEGGQGAPSQQQQAAAPVQITPEMIRDAVQAGSTAAAQASIAAVRAGQPPPEPDQQGRVHDREHRRQP